MLDKKALLTLNKDYAEYYESPKAEYVVAFYKTKEVAISVYKSKEKDKYKVLFQGEGAYEAAFKYGHPQIKTQGGRDEKLPVKAPLPLYPMVGSDEVGTGDAFGGISVAAAYIKESDLPFLEELGVGDSKKLSDEDILKRVPQLIRKIPYSQLYLTPEKYNEVHPDNNMNQIKAKMHNRVLYNLLEKYPRAHPFLDQFVAPSKYYSYLKGEPTIVRGIAFSPKGESLYPAVAAASMIARYSFLRKMEEMSKEYGIDFPLGSSSRTKEFATYFLKEHKDLLSKVAKSDFATFRKTLEEE